MRILIIDDDPAVLRSLEMLFARQHDVTAHNDPIDGLQCALNEDFDGILVDMRMPRMPGKELVEKLVHARPEVQRRVVLLTGGDATDSMALPAPVVWKPLGKEELDRLLWWWGGN